MITGALDYRGAAAQIRIAEQAFAADPAIALLEGKVATGLEGAAQDLDAGRDTEAATLLSQAQAELEGANQAIEQTKARRC